MLNGNSMILKNLLIGLLPCVLLGWARVADAAVVGETEHTEARMDTASGNEFGVEVTAAAKPVFSPKAGTYDTPQSVTISDATAGAKIYYTTDGSTPTIGSSRYTGPIAVTASEILKAIAVATGDKNSAVAIADYLLTVATPTFSLPSGVYNVAKTVTITDKNPKATIYYTTNGSVPTKSSTKYTTPVAVSSTETLRAIAIKTGFSDSAVGASAYRIILETVLHAFNFGVNGSTDGADVEAPLIQGSDGNLYGTTYSGGTHVLPTGGGGGTVFKVTPSGEKTTLHSFGASATDGENPYAPLVEGADGNFYGTASSGGAKGFANGSGAVFKVSKAGQESVIYSFNPEIGDGYILFTNGLVVGPDGDFYGLTTSGGGYLPCGSGTVYRVTAAGKETVLYCFGTNGSSDGDGPYGNLVAAADGNFYGTTSVGGMYGHGTVFKITPAGQETVLHSFTGCESGHGCGIAASTDGARPLAGLIQASDGNLYGTTQAGGVNQGGTVFKVTLGGEETVLHSFDALINVSPDGSSPTASLVQASDGNLYGSTPEGGIYGNGTIFEITLSGTETVIFAFDGTNGSVPQAAVIEGKNTDLYGTTSGGGVGGGGVVFKLTGVIVPNL
jgi:uncharacterized repeat protein (TIGR03803 family)